MAKMRGLRRGGWLVAIALAAGMLSALTVALTLAAPARSIPRGSGYSLSDEGDDRWSYFPDIAVSPDGDKVAVVWSEAYTEEVEHRPGTVKLRWASETEGSGWRAPVTVFAGSDQACAAWATVALTQTTAHIAYVVASPCVSATEQAIHYRTYELGGALGTNRVVASRTLAAAEAGFGKVDVAVDVQGNPHFLYVYYPTEGINLGTVYYRQFVGGSLGLEETVSGERARNPAIAWAGGYVHAVWEDLTEGSDPQILYIPRDEDEWQHGREANLTNNRGNVDSPPRNPNIAAHGGQVVVTWDWEWTEDRYVLAYARYLGGAEWLLAREVGTEVDLSVGWPIPEPECIYTSTAVLSEVSQYLLFLRPSVALDHEGKPTVVWHANLGLGDDQDDWDYGIMSIQAQSMTVSGTAWLTPTTLNPSAEIEHSGSPAVAMAPVISPHVHVAYLHNTEQAWQYGDWDTYYFGGAENGHEYSSAVHLPFILRGYSSATLLDQPAARIEPAASHPAESHRRQEQRDG